MFESLPLDWQTALVKELEQPYFKKIIEQLKIEDEKAEIFPPAHLRLQALQLTPLEKTKVLILGQDPYHQKGQAHGLAFSVQTTNRIPPSLRNIYQEIQSDTGQASSTKGDLTSWGQQGVLLLNSTLTVRANQANAHSKIGWQNFTDAIIKILNEQERPIVFILWGNFAAEKAKLITAPWHKILLAPHPSPLSAYRGFFGSRPFSQTNDFLLETSQSPIVW